MSPKLLLLMGLPGVGKSEVLSRLARMDRRFIYVTPITTRQLRVGETSKRRVSRQQFEMHTREGEFVFVNELYGAHYGTPRRLILAALTNGQFPMLDWPLSELPRARATFSDRVFAVYLLPPDERTLRQRLIERDGTDARLSGCLTEVQAATERRTPEAVDLTVVSDTGSLDSIASLVAQRYLASLGRQSSPTSA